jgi:putative spermidine/putrescine transport system substrate-binding protein
MKLSDLLSPTSSPSRAKRRTVMKGIAAGIAMPMLRPARAQTRMVNLASYGGSYADALRKAWFDPFEKKTGIKVNVGANASLSLAKLQIMNPNGAEWDIVDLTGPEYSIAVRDNILLPLDKKRVDTSKIFPEYVRSHGFDYALITWAIGWDRRRVTDANAPRNWADFWDMRKYQGKRTLQTVKTNGNSLEAALLADGVAMDKIYPMDVDRALKSLEKLGKNNIVWAQTNQEPVQRLMSGETPLAGVFTGRALIANRGGAQIRFTMNQSQVGTEVFGVVKNAKNSAEAFELLNYIASRGDAAAEFTAITSYAVPHVDVERLLPKEADDVRATLPTNPANKGKIHLVNEQWWSENLERVSTRFREWQLE